MIDLNITDSVFRLDVHEGHRFSMEFNQAVSEIASKVGADRYPTRISILFALTRGDSIEVHSRGKIRFVYTMDGSVSVNDARFIAEHRNEVRA